MVRYLYVFCEDILLLSWYSDCGWRLSNKETKQMTIPLSHVPFVQTHIMVQLCHKVELNSVSPKNENIVHIAVYKSN